MGSMYAAVNTISFKPFTDRRHALFAETCVSNHQDPQWLFPRVIFREQFQERAFNTPVPLAGKP